jgi:hypothetical protein
MAALSIFQMEVLLLLLKTQKLVKLGILLFLRQTRQLELKTLRELAKD